MNWRITGALVAKDVTLFFRNRFFALISILGIVAYVVIYFVMPRQVDETLEIGLYAPVIPPPFLELMEAEGIIIQNMDSEAAMKEAMLAGDFFVGVVLPADTMEKIAAGQKGTIHIYFTSDFPDDLK